MINHYISKKIIILGAFLFVFLLINLSISHSHYIGKIINPENYPTLLLTSGGINVEYSSDSAIITANSIGKGWTTTKTFSITSNINPNSINSSDKSISYHMQLIINENDYLDNNIVYSLAVNNQTDNNGELAAEKNNIGIVTGENSNGINIGNGKLNLGTGSHTYDLTLEYNGSETAQANSGKKFSAKVEVLATDKSFVTINLNGGKISGPTLIALENEQGGGITLETPTKEGYIFDNWIVTKGNGSIEGNTLKVNNGSVTVDAIWKTSSQQVVVLDLNGGTTTDSIYKVVEMNSMIEITPPTKTSFDFSGWTIIGESNAEINGNTLTIREHNVILKANWTPSKNTINQAISTNTDTYRFVNTKDEYTWESNNIGAGGTTATSTWNVISDGTYEIEWSVTSETGLDIFTIIIDGKTIVTASGENKLGNIKLSEGTHTVKATYAKDSNTNIGLDKATLKFSTVVMSEEGKLYLNGKIADEVIYNTVYYIDGKAENNATVVYNESNKFELISNNTWESNNIGMGGATSTTIWNVTSDGNYVLSWEVSSEPANDQLTIKIDEKNVVRATGQEYGEVRLEAGSHFIKASYSKDGTINVGLDKAIINFSTITINNDNQLMINNEIADNIIHNGTYYKNGKPANYIKEKLSGSYKFVESSNNTWESNNTGAGGASASTTWDVTSDGNLTIEWSVSSEAGCDNLSITIDKQQVVKVTGEENGKIILKKGRHIINATYSKDGNTNTGSDKAIVRFVEPN